MLMKNFSPKTRQLSLDVLRGTTLMFMIIVNTPGDWGNIFAPLKHAAWHGCTPTDLVFPAFLFIVGNSMSFSFAKYSNSSGQLFKKVFKRSAIIFVIGILLGLFPAIIYQDGGYVWKDFSEIRFWGVLQRIGLCYFLGATIIMFIS